MEGRAAASGTEEALKIWLGVHVFCITIDARSRNFFPTLFGRGGYAIISNPIRLPALMPLLLKHIMLD